MQQIQLSNSSSLAPSGDCFPSNLRLPIGGILIQIGYNGTTLVTQNPIYIRAFASLKYHALGDIQFFKPI